jgi:indolepyruvate ferredoxin oxidoreductase beta subunit
MPDTTNILFTGVGGQGILLASEITSDALIETGLDVKKSEVHGMAQRGGAVEAHLRFGEKVYSPLIEPGSAHVQVSFELMESLRYVHFLNSDTKVIVNTQKIFPLTVATGVESYPEDVIKNLRSLGVDVYAVDAFNMAKEIGEIRVVNIILVGMLSRFLPVKEEVFFDIIKNRVKKQFVDVNLEAFKRGRELINQEVSE